MGNDAIFLPFGTYRDTSRNIQYIVIRAFAMQNPRGHSILTSILSPIDAEGAFQRRILEMYHTIERTSIEGKGIYNNEINEKIRLQKHLGTELINNFFVISIFKNWKQYYFIGYVKV